MKLLLKILRICGISYSKIIKILKKVGKFLPFLEPYIYKLGRKYAKRSKGEILIESWLIDNNINYKSEYLVKFPFKVKTKKFTFIDFYLPEHKTVIEYNGKQHYEYVPFFHKTYQDFILQKRRDIIIKDYCSKKGINFVEIPYTMNVDEIFKTLKKSIE
jgi:hypothetical protein